MKLQDVSLNEKFFEGWTLQQLKDYYEPANLKNTGLSVEKLAELLKIEVPKKANKPE